MPSTGLPTSSRRKRTQYALVDHRDGEESSSVVKEEDPSTEILKRQEGEHEVIHEPCLSRYHDSDVVPYCERGKGRGEPPHPHPPTMTKNNTKKSMAPLYAFCAALNSCNLGYDLGVSTNVGPLLQTNLQLSDDQIELFLGSLNFWSIFGALASPYVCDWGGRRFAFGMAAIMFVGGCLWVATAHSFETIMMGRCVIGLAVGVGEAIDPMYIAEISPAHQRGYLVSWAEAGVAVGVVFGFSSGFLKLVFPDEQQNSHLWRIMLALGAVLPVVMLLLLGCNVLPESPRWLLSKGREEEARRVLETIYPASVCSLELQTEEGPSQSALHSSSNTTDQHDQEDDHNNSQEQQFNHNSKVETIVQDMHDSIALEQEAAQAMGWYSLLCRPSPAVRRMLLVGVGMAIIQQAVGIDSIMFYLMYVIQESGIESEWAQLGALMLLGTVKLAFVMVGAKLFDSAGRRPLLLVSLVGCAFSLIVVSLMFAAESHWSKILIVVGLAFYLAFFSTGLGPGNWVVVSEVFATSIRAKAMSVAVLPNRITATIMASTFLSLANFFTWPGFFLILAGICLASAVFLFVYLPETKGRTLEEMSLYFAEITGDMQFLQAEERLGKQHQQHHHHLFHHHRHSDELSLGMELSNVEACSGRASQGDDDDESQTSSKCTKKKRLNGSERPPMIVPIVLLALSQQMGMRCSAFVPPTAPILLAASRQQQIVDNVWGSHRAKATSNPNDSVLSLVETKLLGNVD